MFFSLFKRFFKTRSHLLKLEMLSLGISDTLLKQALQGDNQAQLEIAGHYFAAKNKKLLTKAIYWFRKSANNNNPDAMFSLATLYYRGIGIKKNLAQAIYWYQKAAQLGQTNAQKTLYKVTLELLIESAAQGDSQAMYELARHYLTGTPTKEDYLHAKLWLEKAVELKHIKAIIHLANLYDQGLLPYQDATPVAQLYLQAAQAGDTTACLNIATMYLTGKGISKNIEASLFWFEQAAQKDNSQALFNLANLYYQGKEIPPNEAKAFSYFSSAAQLGHAAAMYHLATLYQQGHGVSKDLTLSHYWLQRASQAGYKAASQALITEQLAQYAAVAAQGNRTAALQYINLCATTATKVDHDALLAWLLKAAEHNDSDAMLDIANFYNFGTPPLEQNYQLAMLWLRKSAALSNNQAIHLIGSAYLAGQGVPQDTHQAINWFQKAAALNNDKAMVNLANLYSRGDLIKQDYQTAYLWFKQAAHLGNSAAMQSLSYLYQHGLGIAKDAEQASFWQHQVQQLTKPS